MTVRHYGEESLLRIKGEHSQRQGHRGEASEGRQAEMGHMRRGESQTKS